MGSTRQIMRNRSLSESEKEDYGGPIVRGLQGALTGCMGGIDGSAFENRFGGVPGSLLTRNNGTSLGNFRYRADACSFNPKHRKFGAIMGYWLSV